MQGASAVKNRKTIALRGYIYAKVGKSKEAHEVLSTLEAVSHERYVPPYATALVHAGLGQHDSALDWLNELATRTTCIGSFRRWIQNGIVFGTTFVSQIF